MIDKEAPGLPGTAIFNTNQEGSILFEHTTNAVFLADLLFHFIDINPAACQIFGYTKQAFLVHSLYDILLEKDL